MVHAESLSIDGAQLDEAALGSVRTHNDERQPSMAEELPDVYRYLDSAGVGFVEVQYDGRAGDGEVDSIRFFTPDTRRLDIGLSAVLRTALVEFFTALLNTRCPEWKINEGACGEFVWDIISDNLEHRHVFRYLEFETSFHHGL